MTATFILANCHDCGRTRKLHRLRCRACRILLLNRPTCRHCHARAAGPSHRGLCWMCHRDVATRALYPLPVGSSAEATAQGLQAGNRKPREPARPTRHYPGTRGKCLVMMRRFERGEGVFHPLDARRPL